MKMSALNTRWLLPRAAMIAALGMASGCMSGEGVKVADNKVEDLPAADIEQVAGTVVRIKTVGVNGSQEECSIVYVTMEDGDRIAVDLGPAGGLKDANLKVGGKLTAWGVIGSCEGEPVLLADEAEINGRKLQIADHDMEMANEPAGSPEVDEDSEEYQFSGKIVDQDRVEVRGTYVNHIVAILQTPEGSKLLLDLGPSEPIEAASIGKGAQVSVKGRAVKVNGRQVLVANEVKIGDTTLSIDHDERIEHKVGS